MQQKLSLKLVGTVWICFLVCTIHYALAKQKAVGTASHSFQYLLCNKTNDTTLCSAFLRNSSFHRDSRQQDFRAGCDAVFVSVLSLFTFVQFGNQGCVTASGDNGTCLTSAECAQRGGSGNGPCAAGFGTCCICEYYCW